MVREVLEEWQNIFSLSFLLDYKMAENQTMGIKLYFYTICEDKEIKYFRMNRNFNIYFRYQE